MTLSSMAWDYVVVCHCLVLAQDDLYALDGIVVRREPDRLTRGAPPV
ncbi:hypothetical protein WDZ17_13510 [Pseudokineococcus basanitobsidens]|uniref:Uncharacterized protein n=1 Tax=Pseudokineococcus basanitobsidens TaxID=1926649 RepID=A0ABU8RMM5_9ACTN